VGGGKRCQKLIEMIKKHKLQEISPKIVAIADKRDNASDIFRAEEEGFFVTKDYNDFFDRDDINLIVELTGDQNIYNDILDKKRKNVRAVDNKTAFLFWEILRVSNMQQEAEQKLTEKGTLCDVVMNDLLQEDVMTIGADYRIQDINKSMLERLGLELKDAVGQYCYEITHHQKVPCSGEKHPCPLVLAIESRKPSQTTHIHLDKDSNEIYYSISCYPIFQEGKVTGAIEISRDITEDINRQKVMMQQEKLISVGRLSAGVAHEINNPLTTILTTALLLQEDIEPDDLIYEDLGLIANETLRCRKIVTSLLDFARQTQPEKKKNDIDKIVTESILLTKKQAAFNDVAVEHHFSENIPSFNFDKGQIHQAIINLILNALEATPSGGRITVDILFSSQDQIVEISVNDTGEGIAKDKMDKIFDPFFTTKETGTGLGLAITHGIIEQHDGTINVKSKLGHGTTFTINLPIGKGQQETD
ncbi:ATP-binding protein, partial [Desulfobacterales bacterium HSG16]|nr:ATP-binding protein [Desulfobacterales bacterium HSG16]